MARFIEVVSKEGAMRLLNTDHISLVDVYLDPEGSLLTVDCHLYNGARIERIRFESQEAMTDFIEKNFIFFNK